MHAPKNRSSIMPFSRISTATPLRVTTSRRLLIGILGASALLRAWLIAGGGQFYWPDEIRYVVSRQAMTAIAHNAPADALRILFHTADHLGFKVLGLVPAALEQIFGDNEKIPALFFSVSSLLILWAVWSMARRLRASADEALTATFLLACSATCFYYSRHLLPYDVSMACGLWGMSFAVKENASWKDAVLCGVLAVLAFLTYNGYWTLTALVAITHVLVVPGMEAAPFRPKAMTMLRRAAFTSIGGALPPALLLALSAAFHGDLLHSFQRFSQSVTQGDFTEGWRLPIAYLWHAEHGLLVFWAVAGVFCGWRLARGPRQRRLVIYLTGVCLLYGSFVLFSVGLRKFVVYGRIARQLVPFFCLMAAYSVYAVMRLPRFGKALAVALLAGVALQAGVNFASPLTQRFPREFARDIRSAIRDFPHSGGTFEALYIGHLYPVPHEPSYPVAEEVLQTKHPLQYLPYQYEGYDPQQRRALRTTDIRMRLLYIPQ